MATQTIDIRVVDKTQRALSNIENRLGRIQSSMIGVNKVAGLAAAALGAIGGANLIRGITQTTARFQDLRTTLNSVLGSAQDGAVAFDFVRKFATQTQFGVEELTTAYIKLASNGLNPSRELLTTFTDAAAVTTDQLGTLQALTDVYTRSLQSQTVELTELDKLADRGLPVYDILNEKLGVSRGELNKFSKEAGNTEKIIAALGEGINERFGGATQNRVKNLSTALSNMQIEFQNIQAAIGEGGLRTSMTNLILRFNDLLARALPLAQVIGAKLGGAIDVVTALMTDFDGTLQGFNTTTQIVIAGVAGLTVAFGAAGLLKVVRLATTALRGLFALMIANPIGLVVTAVAGLAAYLSMQNGLGRTIAQVSAVFDYFGSILHAVGQFIRDSFSKIIEKVTAAFDNFVNGIIDGINAIAEFLGFEKIIVSTSEDLRKAIGEEVTGAYESLAGGIESAINAGSDFVDGVITQDGAVKDLVDTWTQAGKQYDLSEQATKSLGETTDQTTDSVGQLSVQLADVPQQLSELSDEGNNAAEAMKKVADRTEELSKQLIDQSIFGVLEEQKAIDGVMDKIKEKYDLELKLASDTFDAVYNLQTLFELEIANLRTDNARKVDQRIRELEERRIKDLLRLNKSGIAQQLAEYDKYALQRIGQEERQEQIIANRIEFEKKSDSEKYQFLAGQASSFFSDLAKVNKKYARAAKIAAIAEATINTYTGATKALATYPPPFNFIAAAAVVASGLAQVAAIRAQPMQRGGALQIGQGTLVGEDGPELIVPKQPGTVIPREVAEAIGGMNRGDENVIVNFNINTVDAEGFDELLIQRRGTITGIINQALQKRGKQGVV